MATSFQAAENYQEFMIAFARSVLMWQTIEQELFVLFDRVVKSQASSPVTSAIFYRAIGFKARLDMVDASMRMAYEGHAHLESWLDLEKKLRAGAKIRNKLAHAHVVAHTPTDKVQTLRLTSSAYDVRDGQDVEYTLGQMKGWEKSFLALMRDLDSFLRELRIRIPRRQKSSAG